ncbi:MAG TPA: adenylosuccinate synthase [Methanosarcinales archaeon]|nr:adenylosuccinate synthase [Methanosarcinales archaeon]
MFTIITGSQFGDEGKGKIVDLLAKDYDIVVRFQGGNNAGHTVVVKDKTYKLHTIPSGVLYNSRLLIGPGVVLNPKILMEEIAGVGGISTFNKEKLGIDAKTSIIMPYHLELDELSEKKRPSKIGTTKRGIGFAYMDKIARDEIQFADLINKEQFLKRVSELAPQKEAMISSLGGNPDVVRDKALIQEYIEIGEQLKDYVTDVSYEVNMAIEDGKKVLAEGAQGAHLDVIHGTQKYVTSSCTISGSACANLGVGPTKVDNIIGIVKAYITRVGGGPLPTELKDEVGEHLRQKGKEFGTTTGRPRRCGWFDFPLVKKAVYLNGYTSLALTKLDVLTGLNQIKICIAYRLKGKILEYPPELSRDLEKCKPVYMEMEGWKEDLNQVKTYHDLPINAKKYISKLEELIGVNIKYISVGPERDQIVRNDNDSLIVDNQYDN